MIGLVQRVSQASVSIAGEVVGETGPGALVLVGVERDDGEPDARRLIERVLNYRIFPDSTGRMNLSLADTKGGLLLVPQFTLAADTRKGTRASFAKAKPPKEAATLFAELVKYAENQHSDVAKGQFGADMQVALINDGPVTFWLNS